MRLAGPSEQAHLPLFFIDFIEPGSSMNTPALTEPMVEPIPLWNDVREILARMPAIEAPLQFLPTSEVVEHCSCFPRYTKPQDIHDIEYRQAYHRLSYTAETIELAVLQFKLQELQIINNSAGVAALATQIRQQEEAIKCIPPVPYWPRFRYSNPADHSIAAVMRNQMFDSVCSDRARAIENMCYYFTSAVKGYCAAEGERYTILTHSQVQFYLNLAKEAFDLALSLPPWHTEFYPFHVKGLLQPINRAYYIWSVYACANCVNLLQKLLSQI